MTSTSISRVARRGIVLRRLHPVSSKLSTPLFVATRATSLRSLSANSPAARHFSASACVFVAKNATKAAAKRKTATSAVAKKPVKKVAKKVVKKVVKKTAKKAAAKKKTTARRTAAKKKTTPKKKVLTEEQKEMKKMRLKSRREKAKEKELRAKKRDEKQQLLETGLVGKEPKNLPTSGWMVFLAEKFKANPKVKISEILSTWAAEYKELSPTELERYKATATQNVEANKTTYEAWVKTLPAKDTYLANKARRRLTQYFNKKVRLINDARIPKRPSGPFMEFVKSRPQSGGTIMEAGTESGKEWKAMTDAQKQPYVDLWAKDKERYVSEMKAIGINVDA